MYVPYTRYPLGGGWEYETNTACITFPYRFIEPETDEEWLRAQTTLPKWFEGTNIYSPAAHYFRLKDFGPTADNALIPEAERMSDQPSDYVAIISAQLYIGAFSRIRKLSDHSTIRYGQECHIATQARSLLRQLGHSLIEIYGIQVFNSDK